MENWVCCFFPGGQLWLLGFILRLACCWRSTCCWSWTGWRFARHRRCQSCVSHCRASVRRGHGRAKEGCRSGVPHCTFVGGQAYELRTSIWRNSHQYVLPQFGFSFSGGNLLASLSLGACWWEWQAIFQPGQRRDGAWRSKNMPSVFLPNKVAAVFIKREWGRVCRGANHCLFFSTNWTVVFEEYG